LASRIKGHSFKECLEWLPEEKNLIHIVEKSTGERVNAKIRYLTEEPFFFLNMINAFEEDVDGKKVIVLDLLGYDSPDILDQVVA
jgi:carotenoid cleavage dioxygenase-like enzyme